MKNREHFKIKKVVDGLHYNEDWEVEKQDVYVQITQDKNGTSISLNDYHISLTRLGYKLVRDI